MIYKHMPLKLMVESQFDNFNANYQVLVENDEKTNMKKYLIEGPFVQTNVKNRNGRVYPKELMVTCVNDYIADRLDPKKGIRSYGELGHPDGIEINPDRISHYTISMYWNGDDCMGKAEILDTPMGKIVQTILDKGLRLATSTRGLGSLDDRPTSDNSKRVNSYEMIASDIVIDPSAPQGYVDGILENKQYIIKNEGENKVFLECFDRAEAILASLPKNGNMRNKSFYDALQLFLK